MCSAAMHSPSLGAVFTVTCAALHPPSLFAVLTVPMCSTAPTVTGCSIPSQDAASLCRYNVAYATAPAGQRRLCPQPPLAAAPATEDRSPRPTAARYSCFAYTVASCPAFRHHHSCSTHTVAFFPQARQCVQAYTQLPCRTAALAPIQPRPPRSSSTSTALRTGTASGISSGAALRFRPSHLLHVLIIIFHHFSYIFYIFSSTSFSTFFSSFSSFS
jgi:hypothetical protein